MTAKLMVFDQNGSPSEKWHHFDPLLEETLQRAHNAIAKEGDHDKFAAFVHRAQWDQLLSGILCIQLDSSELLNSSDLIHVLTRGVQHCVDKRILDSTKARQLLKNQCEKAVDAMTANDAEYTVVSRLSVPQGRGGAITLEYDGVVIETLDPERPLPSLPKRLAEARGLDHRKQWEACKYPLIVSRVRSFSPCQALQQVSRTLELVRAIATLHAIHNTSSVQIVGNRSKPLSEMLIGPLHLVSEDGLSSFVNLYLYEDQYVGITPVLSNEAKWCAVKPRVIGTLERLAALPYRVDAANLFIRYGSAMNETRWTLALLGLWAVLEHITGTVGRDQPKMPRWATRLPFSDSRAARFIEYARCTRNRIVHSGHQSEINEQWAQLIRPMVEEHLLRLADQFCGVKSLDEYRQLLRLPEDNDDVTREAELRMAVVHSEPPGRNAPP